MRRTCVCELGTGWLLPGCCSWPRWMVPKADNQKCGSMGGWHLRCLGGVCLTKQFGGAECGRCLLVGKEFFASAISGRWA